MALATSVIDTAYAASDGDWVGVGIGVAGMVPAGKLFGGVLKSTFDIRKARNGVEQANWAFGMADNADDMGAALRGLGDNLRKWGGAQQARWNQFIFDRKDLFWNLYDASFFAENMYFGSCSGAEQCTSRQDTYFGWLQDDSGSNDSPGSSSSSSLSNASSASSSSSGGYNQSSDGRYYVSTHSYFV